MDAASTASLFETLRAAVPGASIEIGPAADMPTAWVDREHLVAVCEALRDHPALQFALLADVTAVDRLPASPRYELVYHLACLGEAYAAGTAAPPRRLRLKVAVTADDVRVPTVSAIYPTAVWPEREVFDLFGVSFDHHPDLRRILMPEDWTGHPLRKDYPVQIRKTAEAWEPLQLSVEEFAAHVRAERSRAGAAAEESRPPRD